MKEYIAALKDIMIGLGLVLLLPLFIPLAVVVLTFYSIKDKLRRCPNCGSRKLILKGKSRAPWSAEDTGTGRAFMSRMSPLYSLYECSRCHKLWKATFGTELTSITAEEAETYVSL